MWRKSLSSTPHINDPLSGNDGFILSRLDEDFTILNKMTIQYSRIEHKTRPLLFTEVSFMTLLTEAVDCLNCISIKEQWKLFPWLNCLVTLVTISWPEITGIVNQTRGLRQRDWPRHWGPTCFSVILPQVFSSWAPLNFIKSVILLDIC